MGDALLRQQRGTGFRRGWLLQAARRRADPRGWRRGLPRGNPEGHHQVPDGVKTLGGQLGNRPQDDRLNGRVQVRCPGQQGGRRLLEVLDGQLARGIAGEGLLTGQHLVQRNAQRIDVAAAVQVLTHPLLGTHVGLGAGHVANLGDLQAAVHTGQPEVGEDRIPEVAEQHVAGVDVTVDHAALVGVVDRAADLLQHVQRLRQGERAFFQNAALEAAVLHQRRYQVQQPPFVVGAVLEDREDVRVLQRGNNGRLAREARGMFRVLIRVEAHHLDRDLAVVQAELLPAVDNRHPTFADSLDEPEFAINNHAVQHLYHNGRFPGRRKLIPLITH